MGKARQNERGITVFNTVIFLGVLSILMVVAVPRYDRFTKIRETKAGIRALEKGAREAFAELEGRNGDGQNVTSASDAEWIRLLEQHLDGPIPPNPFSHASVITVSRVAALSPCEYLQGSGGWIWSLVPSHEKGKPPHSRFWLNSDTVNIGQGKGEACIQP